MGMDRKCDYGFTTEVGVGRREDVQLLILIVEDAWAAPVTVAYHCCARVHVCAALLSAYFQSGNHSFVQ